MYQNERTSSPHNVPADCRRSEKISSGISRRRFLGGLGGTAALAGLTLTSPSKTQGVSTRAIYRTALPAGSALRVKPVLTYEIEKRREKTSWRGYGGVQTQANVTEEARRIENELKKLSSEADFLIDVLPVALVDNEQKAKEAAGSDCDTMLMYPAGGSYVYTLAASQTPKLMFLRHKSGPHYLWYEIAHWRFLRRNGDTFEEQNMDVDDIIVDDYGEVMWRLRALYGLKNARGTKMLAIGGLNAYSRPGQELGPKHARKVWNYEVKTISEEDFAKRLQKARRDEKIMKEAEQQTDELLSEPNVILETKRKFVVNSFLALRVCRDLMQETGATNFGFAGCMGRGVIEMLDTPPCLLQALANDEGHCTGFCHTDLTHTVPGVLLRWISGKPVFLGNSHFPHHGILTVAHCSAPRKMNGRDCEPTRIMTHFESDYGAATKVQYTKGQTVTVIIPNLRCTKWLGFRGRIIANPSHPACRSQMDIQVDGDFRRLLTDMEGFHTLVCYGDYLREVGYACDKVGLEWQNITTGSSI